MPQGKATPLHVHPDADETFYVLEGEVRVHIAGTEDRVVSNGSVVGVPRGTPRAFAVISPAAHMLVIMTPASTISETFFRLAGEPAADPTLPPPPPNMERFGAAVARSGLQVLGPPRSLPRSAVQQRRRRPQRLRQRPIRAKQSYKLTGTRPRSHPSGQPRRRLDASHKTRRPRCAYSSASRRPEMRTTPRPQPEVVWRLKLSIHAEACRGYCGPAPSACRTRGGQHDAAAGPEL
jgi:hypothetical protein